MQVTINHEERKRVTAENQEKNKRLQKLERSSGVTGNAVEPYSNTPPHSIWRE